jgi:ABC-type polysaccharide/polyol phosphate transport system ATPase subunit
MTAVISVSGLSKTYKLYSSKSERAKDLLIPFGRPRHKDFHALSEIGFEVGKSESIGIIGKNGSGKSTLLKILSGVLSPTKGLVKVNGTVASLLELGAGFNPELTGRENIYFNGALMGQTQAEVRERIDEVIAFADIGDFIDQPVKVYSSGMFVRLAFSASVHVDPDILIIDEALAVGDVRFQKKCIDFMRRFRDQGKTILFVSHDIYTVKSFCDRLILINDGKMEAIGEPDMVANRYFQLMFPNEVENSTPKESSSIQLKLSATDDSSKYWMSVHPDEKDTQWGHGAARITSLRVGGLNEPNIFNWKVGLELELVCRWDQSQIAELCRDEGVKPELLFGFRFENSKSWVICNFASSMLDDQSFALNPLEYSECVLRCTVAPMKLAAGHYFITPSIALGTQSHLFPLKEYTNLIHLYCDTSKAVLGQMEHEYTYEILGLG